MIKKHDDHAVEGYDIEEFDQSVLSGRNLDEVAGDAGSREWKSRPTGRGKLKAPWLADAVARLDQKKAAAGALKKKQQLTAEHAKKQTQRTLRRSKKSV